MNVSIPFSLCLWHFTALGWSFETPRRAERAHPSKTCPGGSLRRPQMILRTRSGGGGGGDIMKGGSLHLFLFLWLLLSDALSAGEATWSLWSFVTHTQGRSSANSHAKNNKQKNNIKQWGQSFSSNSSKR